MSKNYYEILGIDKAAEPKDIKKAYRALSMEHHPDKGGDAEKFKEINEAYSTLSDPDKRADYDNPMRNMGNPFEDMMRGFNFGGAPFGRSYRPDPNAPRQGRHIKMERKIPLHLFIFGGNLKVSFKFNDICSGCVGKGATEFDRCGSCNGTGRTVLNRIERGVHIQSSIACQACRGRGASPTNQCEVCSGQGTIPADREVTLPIPRGIRDGQVAGAAGQGGHGTNGGPPGDLLVKLHMEYPDPDKITDKQRKILEEL